MQGKYRINELLADNVNGPQNLDFSLAGTEDFSVEFDYATATVGNIELQTSNSGINFPTITGATTPVVPAGDYGIMQVSKCHTLTLRVVIPAGVTGCSVRLVGERIYQRE